MGEQFIVKSQRSIARNIYELIVTGDKTEAMKTPGQFVHIQIGQGTEHMLRRPISICRVENNELTMLYRAEGKGTQFLSNLRSGDRLDILTPLGQGFDIHQTTKKALLVGGGIGVPPMYELAHQLKSIGKEVEIVLGFNDQQDVFYENEFNALGKTHIATANGSYGTKGFVTDIIETLDDDFDTFYSCGPMPMLKALTHQLSDKKGYISLEERMGCGIGACFACVVPADNDKGYVKICSDGPVFESGALKL